MATLTEEQIKQARARGVSEAQIQRFMTSGTAVPQTQQKTVQEERPFMQNVGVGMWKSLGSTALGLGQLGRGFQRGVSKVTGLPITGGEIFDVGSEQNTRARKAVTTQGAGEKTGKLVGDIAQIAIPAGKVAAGTQGAGMLTRALGQAAVAGTVESAQEGRIGKEAAIAAFIGGASVPAADAISYASRKLSTALPEWLVKPLVKQAKDAKVQGKDIAPYLAKSGRVGSAQSLVNQTDDVIDDIARQVDDIITASSKQGATLSVDDIAVQLADDLNAQGAATSADDILKIVDRLSPQARGLLAKKTLTLKEANQLRSSIDATLGDRGFLNQQLPYNKQVLRGFTNSLREGVKNGVDDVAPSVLNQINSQTTSINQVLATLPEEQIAAQGGRQEVLKRLKINIVDGLRAQGDDAAAKAVEQISTEGIRSADEFAYLARDAVSPIRSTFNEYAKNITLRNALLDQMSSGVAKNSVGMYDILTGVGAFGATGNPVTAALAVGGRRAFESPAVKTALARVFSNTDDIVRVLSEASPAIRGALVEVIDLLIEDKDKQNQG